MKNSLGQNIETDSQEPQYYYEEDFGYKEEKTNGLDHLNDEMFFYLEAFLSKENTITTFKVVLSFSLLAACVAVINVNPCQAQDLMRSRVRSQKSEWLEPVIEVVELAKVTKQKVFRGGRRRRLGGGDSTEGFTTKVVLKIFETQEKKKGLISIPVEKPFPFLGLPPQMEKVFSFIGLTPQKKSPVLDLTLARRNVFFEKVPLYSSNEVVSQKSTILTVLSTLGNGIFQAIFSTFLQVLLIRRYPFLMVPNLPNHGASDERKKGTKLDTIIRVVPTWLFPPTTRTFLIGINETMKSIDHIKKVYKPQAETAPTNTLLNVFSGGSPTMILPGTMILMMMALFRRKEFDAVINKILTSSGIIVPKKTLFGKVSSFFGGHKVSIGVITGTGVVIIYLNRERILGAMPKHPEAIVLAFHHINKVYSDSTTMMKSTIEIFQKIAQDAYQQVWNTQERDTKISEKQVIEIRAQRDTIEKMQHHLYGMSKGGQLNVYSGEQCQKELAVSETIRKEYTSYIKDHMELVKEGDQLFLTNGKGEAQKPKFVPGQVVPPSMVDSIPGSVAAKIEGFNHEETYAESLKNIKIRHPIDPLIVNMIEKPSLPTNVPQSVDLKGPEQALQQVPEGDNKKSSPLFKKAQNLGKRLKGVFNGNEKDKDKKISDQKDKPEG